jgi:hypothetical protein
MERVLTSFRFLAATTVCCGLVVALATWAVSDSSSGVRLLAALIGLGSSLGVMLLIAWAAAAEEATPVAAPSPPVPAPSAPSEAQALLREHLEAGLALEPDLSDSRVGAWIDDVRHTIELHKPGLLGYFDALAQRAYADDRARLEAYSRRLATIVRDLV